MSRHTPIQLDRVEAILADHVGATSAITSREISERLGGVDSLDSTPNTRALIRELVHSRGVPVVADGNGYYLVDSEAELNSYVENLVEREKGIAERRAAVIAAAYGTGRVGDSSDGTKQVTLQ